MRDMCLYMIMCMKVYAYTPLNTWYVSCMFSVFCGMRVVCRVFVANAMRVSAPWNAMLCVLVHRVIKIDVAWWVRCVHGFMCGGGCVCMFRCVRVCAWVQARACVVFKVCVVWCVLRVRVFMITVVVCGADTMRLRVVL